MIEFIPSTRERVLLTFSGGKSGLMRVRITLGGCLDYPRFACNN